MPEESLHLRLGMPVQLEYTSPEVSRRYPVKVVGYMPGVSLMVTTPVHEGKVLFFREGQQFNVRLLQDDTVTAFASRVLHNAGKPFPHLHLACPRDVESIVIRNAKRAVADIPTTARNTKNPDEDRYLVDSVITDLSNTGARVKADRALGAVGGMLHLVFNLDVAGKRSLLGIVSEIKNCQVGTGDDEDSYIHGVQFRALSRFQELVLHGWVLERVLGESK